MYNYSFHNHTPWCHHAEGTPEEYVKNAIDGKIKFFGFAEHAPFMFPNGYESWYKLACSDVPQYFETLNAIKEKYKDKIDIKIGFEMEYYPQFFDDMYGYVKKIGAEYLILGQHFIKTELNVPERVDSFKKNENVSDLKCYVSSVLAAMKTGVFSYVAHPDVFNFFGDNEIYNSEMEKICVLSKELGIPLEINLNGIFYGRSYPKEAFWALASKVGSPVCVGADAHIAERVCDENSYKKALELCEKYKLNLIEKLNLVPLK